MNEFYLYCIANSRKNISFGKIGIEENEVFVIPHKELSVVIHESPYKVYEFPNIETAKELLEAHQRVIDIAWEKFGTVLPFGFGTFIRDKNGISSFENLYLWLEKEYENFKEKLLNLKDQVEYGIQLFWNLQIISLKVFKSNKELKEIKENIKSKPSGIAYMLKRKLDDLLKEEIEKEADKTFKRFYKRIKENTEEIKIERVNKVEGGKQMLMNLSCLLYKKNYKNFKKVLDETCNEDGFSIHSTGPWPPYSFV